MPTHANRTGVDHPNDTVIVDRQTGAENTIGPKSATAGSGQGCPASADVPNGPHNANVEAVSGGGPAKSGPDRLDTSGTLAEFLTAYGQRDSHAPTLADGRPNGSPRAGKPYGRISWPEVVQLVDAPADRPKDKAQFFIPSTYVEADGRTHAVQRERGVFAALAVDIDTGNPTLAHVREAVANVTGGSLAVVYSSSSAAADNRKWRVLVPLATPITGADYADTQLALFELLAGHGLQCDVTLARAAQPVYLPNVPPHRRGPDGAPLFYQRQHCPGPVLELAPGCNVVVARDALRARRAAEEVAAAERAAAHRAKRLEHVAATGDDFEPIAHFNANHSVADMLARYGFEQKGNDYRSPLSKSNSYSTRDCGNHWVTVSAWAHNHNVGRRTQNGNRAGDAFDLYTHFEHAGDRRAAVRAYAELVRPDRGRKCNGAVNIPAPPEPDAPPPVRVEHLVERPVVSLEDLRRELRADMERYAAAGASLVVVTPEPGVGKTTAAVETLAGRYDRVAWAVSTHEAAAETVARLQAAGHTDAAAIPPRDATTCACWTAEDAARLREEHPGFRHTIPMEDALRVGNGHMACLACPLSGLQKRPAPAVAVDDFAAWADPFGYGAAAEPEPMPEADADGCRCTYWQRKREAERASITVLCQARLTKSELPPMPIGTTRAVVVDEHATDYLLPRATFTLATLRATRDAMATAVDNWRQRKGRMRFSRAREVEHELLGYAEAVVSVGTAIVEHMETLEAAGDRRVSQLPALALDRGNIPKRAKTKLARLLVAGGIPERFSSEALDVIYRAAMGTVGSHSLYTEPVPGGGAHVQLVTHSAWARGIDVAGNTATWLMDANADVGAIRAMYPEAVEIAPRGAAPLAVDAEMWWREINPGTHPAVVVRFLELAIHQRGFQRCGVILCKKHRNVLFPTTRPRGGRRPEDKEPDPVAIANWGSRGGRALAEGTAEQRLARAVALVERVRHLRQFIARDEHGALLVDHHRGPGSRGTNKFLRGTDGGVVLGQSRVPVGDIAGYMLATGRGEAVERSDGNWGYVEGELPAVGGGTTTRRWRGYGCPDWAEAARQVNRAALSQVVERFRTRLESGVPVVLVAAEPCGLPVTDPPAGIPEGVAAVVGAVRELAARTKGVPACEAGQDGGRLESGKRATEHTTDGAADGCSMRQPSTEHTPSPIYIAGWRIETAATLAEVVAATRHPNRSVQRWLADAVRRGLLVRTGNGRWTRYSLPAPAGVVLEPVPAVAPAVEVAPAAAPAPARLPRRVVVPHGIDMAQAPPAARPTPVASGHHTRGVEHGVEHSGPPLAESAAGRKAGPAGGGGSRTGGGRPPVPRGVSGPRTDGGPVGNQRAHAETNGHGGHRAHANQDGHGQTEPDVLAPRGSREIPSQPGRVRGRETGGGGVAGPPPTGPAGIPDTLWNDGVGWVLPRAGHMPTGPTGPIAA